MADSDVPIQQHISSLVEEERALRQRRARREFGADPDGAHERSGREVEGYLG